MPSFWQFPTGSMGLGPISAIYQARFMRYLAHRGIVDTGDRHVWGVFGDGEMDEPESIGALTLAARERLDNLTFVINCNLQRLDGPVRGNGQIIQELESLFTGAGWNVIKVLWGSDWDPLFARDRHHVLLRIFAATVDGQYQTLGANDGAYNQEHFFNLDPELQALVVAHERGGDRRAEARRPRPAQALRGVPRGAGASGPADGDPGEDEEGLRHGRRRRIAHDRAPAEEARRRRVARVPRPLRACRCPTTDVDALRFYRPPSDSREMRYLRERRDALGGFLPKRRREAPALAVPPLESYARFALEADGKEMSTTTAVVRMIGGLLKDRDARAAHRADRRGRGAHVRHGEPVPPDRHLFAGRAALRARGSPARCCTTARRRTGRCWRRASPRPARSRRGPRPRPRTACTACRCCRSTSTTRCSASSASAT